MSHAPRHSFLFSLFAVLASACDQSEPEWVAGVEAAHSAADRAETSAELEGAKRALEQAYADMPQSNDARQTWVRQDLCARIGEASLQEGDAELALSWAEQGLSLSTSATVARADLLGLKGRALESLGRKEEAAFALHEALTVNQSLMERALQGKNLDQGER